MNKKEKTKWILVNILVLILGVVASYLIFNFGVYHNVIDAIVGLFLAVLSIIIKLILIKKNYNYAVSFLGFFMSVGAISQFVRIIMSYHK